MAFVSASNSTRTKIPNQELSASSTPTFLDSPAPGNLPSVVAIGIGSSSLGNDVVKQAISLRELGNQDTAVGAGDVVTNDDRDVRRWRLGQLGFVVEAALWMLVVNAVAHEEYGNGGGGAGGGGNAARVASSVERRLLHEELLDLFDTRLDDHAPLWENLSRGEGGRAPVSISPAFVAHVKGMIRGCLDEARAAKNERDATTPKSRAGKAGAAAAPAGRRAGGGLWSPPRRGGGGGGASMLRQASDMSVTRTPSILGRR